MTSHVNFICLKWGNKYGPEYVNRLYNSIEQLYSGSFSFCCFTDSSLGISNKVEIQDIDELRPNRSECFTIEKIHLFDKMQGRNTLLDLDILLLKDLSVYFKEYQFSEPRFIKNHWMHMDYVELSILDGTNYINSSIVTWKDDQLKYVLDFYNEHRDIIEFKYRDLDTFLFQTIRRTINFHPNDLVYSYNASEYEDHDYSAVMFNTSHGRGIELDRVTGPMKILWTGYDMVN